ncbi:MAG: hypothetical protein ACLR4A_10235 [Christensenellales bacterium]
MRSGKINNRLLGEIILHKDFKRFLLDVEIVVDRIADSYVSSMGTFFSVIRKKFADKFHPDEDLSLRMLELTNIKEPEFSIIFSVKIWRVLFMIFVKLI